MQEQLQIKYLSGVVNALMITNGIASLKKNHSDFAKTTGTFSDLNKIRQFGIDVLPLDNTYYFTSLDNWRTIIDYLYNRIIAFFPWKADSFDCDNRAMLMSSLVSLIFNLNSMGQVYCEVITPTQKYLHWANIFSDGDNFYLLDVDFRGKYTKITSNPVIIDNVKYKLITLRIG